MILRIPEDPFTSSIISDSKDPISKKSHLFSGFSIPRIPEDPLQITAWKRLRVSFSNLSLFVRVLGFHVLFDFFFLSYFRCVARFLCCGIRFGCLLDFM